MEKLSGVVERVTFHNQQNGWSVLKVAPFKNPGNLSTVIIHQAQVFAGATMEFWGNWSHHPKHGEQFKAVRSVEKKPATAAALERYLGSGLITGVGPVTARKIVSHFKGRTLEVFEHSITELTSVPGIASKKLQKIKSSWNEHKSIRDVMIFLQGYGISTLFATKVYKAYGDQAISLVSENPYRLAQDIYGIGFFSADKIALSMGFSRRGERRLRAGIQQVLAASRDEGHCFLTSTQIITKTRELLQEDLPSPQLEEILKSLLDSHQVKVRSLLWEGKIEQCFYSKSLYFDEGQTAEVVKRFLEEVPAADEKRIASWVSKYCDKYQIDLSEEQYKAVCQIPQTSFSILTGGPGCGKTTCTKVLVALLKAMGLRVMLTAPTGRAAQRMGEVIGWEAKTIHRLLLWAPEKNSFKHNEENPLDTDFLILDEASMLDITLGNRLLKALPTTARVLFIGDPDQLPPVGAGSVLADLLKAKSVPRHRLTQVFRQAQKSSIIKFAHQINKGVVPQVSSPISKPDLFQQGVDCLFYDADEATLEQIKFVRKVRGVLEGLKEGGEGALLKLKEEWAGKIRQTAEGPELDHHYRPPCHHESEVRAPVLSIPEKFKHVELLDLQEAESEVAQLTAVLKSVHPWSTLRYGLTALDTVIRLYTQTIPQWFGPQVEIQVLAPQVRGSLGTLNLNGELQRASNPPAENKRELKLGEKILRLGDRVIQTRNNYDLGVFNGDIGTIIDLQPLKSLCTVKFHGGGERTVTFKREDLSELQLAYGITIHKSQGSEFEVVVLPVLGQHYNMLFRNLLYTGLTRAKKLAILVGSRKAFAMAIKKIDHRRRQTALATLID